MSRPVVAIVGATNVGKSTIFNRLLGRRQAIVNDSPGVTRDRIAAPCDLFGHRITLVDTGGMISGDGDDLTRDIRAAALKAAAEADLILFVIDARAGMTAVDEEIAALLRTSGKPLLTVANKIDSATRQGIEFDLYRLGLGVVLPLSAEQGRGMDELVDHIRSALPSVTETEVPAVAPIAIIGRPNVGKSSLFNRLVRQERALVSPAPGTTRDPVDATFEYDGTRYHVVDTAGIRRHARSGREVERVSVLKARRALEAAALAFPMVDGAAEVTHQDLTLLGLVAKSHKPAILVVNKIDLLAARRIPLEERLLEIRRSLRFSPFVPVVGISALTGRGVDRLLAAASRLRAETRRRFATAQMNRALQRVTREKQPPADRGRPVRFYYMTQTGGPPPHFVIFGNGRRVGSTYRRFMEGRLRAHLGLSSSPIVLSFRRRRPS